ncbi:hypothetical protein [Sandaracinobacter sp.]|uniref:hypothetical protein n=1 Tax=Sandaracinobacter sp. TaxID=2487581 RepID=UPI0035B3DA04
MQLRVDKSLVGRWATGVTMPSAQNLARLTALVAARSAGFSMLDWEQPLPVIAERLGVGQRLPAAPPQLTSTEMAAPPMRLEPATQPLRFGPIADLGPELRLTTARRGPAYEGIFRNTRPFSDVPGKFLYDYCLTRMEPEGLITWTRCIGSVAVIAHYLTLHSQIFISGREVSTGLPVFGIVNGSNGGKVTRYEGIMLYSAHDALHTPFATPFISERLADLTQDRAADEARFAEFAQHAGLAPDGAVPPDVRAHLLKDIGPAAFAMGGELMMRMPPDTSMSLSHIPT